MAGPKQSDSKGPTPPASAATIIGPAAHRPADSERVPRSFADGLVDEGEIGVGGSGSVRRVYEPVLRRRLAMKVLGKHLLDRPRARQNFVQEAEITAQLDHPNIVPIHELRVDDDGTTSFTMKLVQGRTLDDLIRHGRGTLDEPTHLRRLLGTFLKVCDAVAFAHSRGVLHCDIKPENVMVGEFGEAYLMDWGISCLGATSVAHPELIATVSADRKPRTGVRGSPAYMSPEQASGKNATFTERTDVFGLGAMLYTIVTGQPPFESPTVDESLARARAGVAADPAARVQTPTARALAPIIKKAMAVDARDRHDSVQALVRDVDGCLRGGAHFPEELFEPGAIVVRQGDPGDAAFILVSGTCVVWKDVHGKRVEIRRLAPGAVFGETAIFSGSRRTATVEAVDHVVVKTVTRQLIEEQLGLDTWLGRFVLALADRFREVDEKLTRVTQDV